MIYLFLIGSIVIFIVGLRVSRTVPRVMLILSETGQAINIIRSTELSDAEKEMATRKISLQMFRAFFLITLSVALVVTASVTLIILGAQVGSYTQYEVMEAATNGYFLIGSTVFIIATWKFVK